MGLTGYWLKTPFGKDNEDPVAEKKLNDHIRDEGIWELYERGVSACPPLSRMAMSTCSGLDLFCVVVVHGFGVVVRCCAPLV